MSQPKSVRVVPKSETKVSPEVQAAVEIAAEITKPKPPIPYEDRLEKMSTQQLRGEIRKGKKGKLSGYCAIPTAVVLDVILDSFEKGFSPVL